MELWVRSQDKTNLILANDIVVSDGNIKVYKDTVCTTVAMYKTKERALEVLDEIEKYINNECEFLIREQHTSMGTYQNKEQIRVYEMPKE